MNSERSRDAGVSPPSTDTEPPFRAPAPSRNKGGRGLPRIAAFAAVLALAQACHENAVGPVPVKPEVQPRPLPIVRNGFQALPSVATYLDAVPSGSIFLGNYDSRKVLGEIRISGAITMNSHENAWYSSHNGPVDARGVFVGGVYQQCSMKLLIAGRGPACFSGGGIGDQVEWIDTVLVTGDVYATRGPGVPWLNPACDSVGSACHEYSGAQAVAFKPFEAKFESVLPGSQFRSVLPSSVYWNSTMTPTHAKGIAMPFRMIARTWQKADPFEPSQPTTASCSLIEKACGAWWRQAGTLIETAYANGTFQSDSIQIYCAESDPLLNHHSIRQGLLAVLDSSKASSADPQLRHERTFLVLQDTVTPGSPPFIFINPRGLEDNACEWNGLNVRLPGPRENAKTLAWGHSHPSMPGETIPCINADGTPGSDAVGITIDLASPEDWIAHRNYNNPQVNVEYAAAGWLPGAGLVLDPLRLMIMRPNGAAGSESDPGNAFIWRSGKCAWPKAVI